MSTSPKTNIIVAVVFLFILVNLIIVCILQSTSNCDLTIPTISSYMQWSNVQLIRSLFNTDSLQIQALEKSTWEYWENNCNVKNGKIKNLQQVLPVLNLHQTSSDKNILQNIDLQQPLLLQNIWHPSTSNFDKTSYKNLSLNGLLSKSNPISNLTLTYFTDATKTVLETDSTSTIREILYNMTTFGSPHKIGSQKPIHTFPELIYEVLPQNDKVIKSIFGNRFEIKDLQRTLFGLLPPFTTVPLFIARLNNDTATSDNYLSSSKTELHCEPIANIAIQLHSQKHWILIPSQYSMLLRPTISKNGRAYFYSKQENITDILSKIPHYKITTKAGDGVYIPPWMWHRVDYYYIPTDDEVGGGNMEDGYDLISIGASLFHFRFWNFIRNNSLFSLLVIPNLIKELFGNNLE